MIFLRYASLLYPCFVQITPNFIAIIKRKPHLQLNLSRVKRWSDEHQLPPNVNKCSHLAFQSNDVEFYLSGNEIHKVATQKGLGIHMSDDMQWNHHIKSTTIQALGVFFMLKRSSPNLSPPTKLKLYKSMVLPVLICGSTCWFPNVENTKNLEGIQKEFLKWKTAPAKGTTKSYYNKAKFYHFLFICNYKIF